MKITFKLVDDQKVKIMNGDKNIGTIKTPAGTTQDKKDGVQICGCSQIFEYWGCSQFDDGKGNPKRDIQLLFEADSSPTKEEHGRKLINGIISSNSTHCGKCFYPNDVCMCKDLTIKEKIEKCYEAIDKNKEILFRNKILNKLDN